MNELRERISTIGYQIAMLNEQYEILSAALKIMSENE